MKQLVSRVIIFSFLFVTLTATAEWSSKPIPIQYDPTPAPKLVTPQQVQNDDKIDKDSANSATQTEPKFTMVDANTFFQNIQTCSGAVAMDTPVVSGKLYGQQNNMCHFSVKLKSTSDNTLSATTTCYVPMATLLVSFIENSDNENTPDLDNLTPSQQRQLDAQNAGDSLDALGSLPSANQFYAALDKFSQYCDNSQTAIKLDQLKKQYQGTSGGQ